MNAGSQGLWDEVEAKLPLHVNPQAQDLRVPIQHRRRRGFAAGELDARAALELTRDRDGVLRWVYQPPLRLARTGRRVYSARAIDQPEVVKRFRFDELGPNDVTEALMKLDGRLNDARGLRRWNGSHWQPAEAALPPGPVLLLVHGTFSSSTMFSEELGATDAGRQRLAAWQQDYRAVLGFDHPTLSVTPWINALELMRALAGAPGPIDIVCHSRGGLVVAWLLRIHALDVRRVVFVGSPLTGTSLASPYRLRAALDLLANFAQAVSTVAGAASMALPLATGAAGIASIFGKTLRLGSSLPIADAAVALVPGLASQQRTRDNLELQQLFASPWQTEPQLAAIGANFQPDESSQGWKFWRRFTHVGAQLLHSAADLVFDDANDLVVDVDAMSALGETGRIDAFCDLGTGPQPHHCSYLRDERVLQFLDAQLAG
jgi:pimeloyl-ACP methyl ester carboxylesterase